MRRRDWVRLLISNRGPILDVLGQALKVKFASQPKGFPSMAAAGENRGPHDESVFKGCG
jgi:hypothetical protein